MKRLGWDRFWLPEPVTPTFPFYSFSTIIGVGVGAGAYILSRYAVRSKNCQTGEWRYPILERIL